MRFDRTDGKKAKYMVLVEQEVNNRRDGWHINFRWVAKKICKPCETEGYVAVPEWAVSNGIW